ncbi:hypothetical protein [Lysinibacillus fusiformis]
MINGDVSSDGLSAMFGDEADLQSMLLQSVKDGTMKLEGVAEDWISQTSDRARELLENIGKPKAIERRLPQIEQSKEEKLTTGEDIFNFPIDDITEEFDAQEAGEIVEYFKVTEQITKIVTVKKYKKRMLKLKRLKRDANLRKKRLAKTNWLLIYSQSKRTFKTRLPFLRGSVFFIYKNTFGKIQEDKIMNFLMGVVVGLVVMLFFYLKAIKTRNTTKKQELYIPRWALPSELNGNTYDPANTTSFTGDEVPAVPTVITLVTQIDETLEVEKVPTFISKNIEVTDISDHRAEESSIDLVEKGVPALISEGGNEKMMVHPVVKQYEAVVMEDMVPVKANSEVYQEAELDPAVATFATMFNFEDTSKEDTLERIESQGEEIEGSYNDDYNAYLMSLESQLPQLEEEVDMESVPPGEVENTFLNIVHTNLITALKDEGVQPEKPQYEPIVLSVDDWFGGEHNLFIEINDAYEDMYTHMIIDGAKGLQTWVVQITGAKDNFIHVSDGTARAWLDVSDFSNKVKDIGSIVMLDVNVSNERIYVETFSLLEEPLHETLDEKLNTLQIVESDYLEDIQNEYVFEEQELYTSIG